jgi:hypothetical protein
MANVDVVNSSIYYFSVGSLLVRIMYVPATTPHTHAAHVEILANLKLLRLR